MNILKKLFGIGSNQPQKETKSWTDTYFATKSMRQIVVEVKSPIWTASRFKHLALPVDKYHTILQNPTSTGFVKMASEPTPILLMRADEFSDALKSATLDIAFSFFRTEKGGILALFVVPQPASLTGGANGHLEIAYGLDNEETVNRIREGWKSGFLELVIADKSDKIQYSNSTSTAPEAKWDFRLPLQPECVPALDEAFNHLLEHHKQTPATKRDYQGATQIVWDLIPQGKSPITPISEGQPNEEIKKQLAEKLAKLKKQSEEFKLATRKRYENFKTIGIEEQSYADLNLEFENLHQNQNTLDYKYNILYAKVGVFDDFLKNISEKEQQDIVTRIKGDFPWIASKYGEFISSRKEENYQRIINRVLATVDSAEKYIAQFSEKEQDDQSTPLSLVVKCLMIFLAYVKEIEVDYKKNKTQKHLSKN